MNQIKAWAWCTGMGSDAWMFFVREDGTLLVYDYYEDTMQMRDFDGLPSLFCQQSGPWKEICCQFNNVLFVRKTDEAWFASLCEAFRLRPYENPYAYVECICQALEENL